MADKEQIEREAVPPTQDQALWISISASDRTITVAAVTVVVVTGWTVWSAAQRRRRARIRQIALARWRQLLA